MLLATADSRMYHDKTRRKEAQAQSAATPTEGAPAIPVLPQGITESEIQRAGFGVL
jgi:hypothetical protein